VDGERLHTFLFADLAGFSALTEAHGDERAAELVGDFCAQARELLAEHRAEEVKAIGDALMLRADDAADAVRLARRLIDDVGGRHGFPGIRVGVHTGPAVERDRDWFGATVNVASRVADLAEADEVLLTRATLDAMEASPLDLPVTARGRRRLRNVREPVELFTAGSAAPTATERVIDPVCRMALDPEAAATQQEFAATTYWFCSLACADAFRSDPRVFVGGRSQAADLRVSDASRERAVEILARARTRGRLSDAEFDERSAHALAARTRSELAALLRDLPGYRRRRAAARWRRAARAIFPWFPRRRKP